MQSGEVGEGAATLVHIISINNEVGLDIRISDH